MSKNWKILSLWLMAGLFGIATPCQAADPSLWAAGYWQDFLDYWRGVLNRQDGVVMTVLAAGAVALFIITRVKGNKG
jgi:hypothetical protein